MRVAYLTPKDEPEVRVSTLLEILAELSVGELFRRAKELSFNPS